MLRGETASDRYGCDHGVQTGTVLVEGGPTMALRSISTRISLYGLVGVVATAVHYGLLNALRLAMPTWLANPLAPASQAKKTQMSKRCVRRPNRGPRA